MTVIVGLAHAGKVYMGGDSAAVEGWNLTLTAAPKVFIRGPFIMGFTSSFRMGQLLEHALTPPEHAPGVHDQTFMVTSFVDAVRSCLKAGGFATKDKEAEAAGTFLVGYRGTLYRVDTDYCVIRPEYQYDACGCGQMIALGSLC